MDFETPNKRALVQLVQKCLSENSEGFIEREKFIEFCSELSVSTDELDGVFNELDSDKDGRINISDFTTSFEQIQTTYKVDNPTEVNSIDRSVDKSLYECQVNCIESPMQVISTSGQQYISELYYNLTNSNQPDLLDLFEKHLASVVKDIKSKAAENQRLEEALKRATKQHARQVNNLEREVEQQMEKLEAKVRQEEKSSYEKKLSDFEWQLEGKEKEISAMNSTIETLQTRLDKETNKPNRRREEIENFSQENRYLKSQVTDSQTTLALLRSELAELKSQFVEQSDQLQKEQSTAQAYFHEQENLARQLQLLYEANQRLQDVNDELRGALEAKKNSTPPPERKMSEVLKLSAVFTDPAPGNRELTSSMRSNGFARSSSPLAGSRLPDYHGANYNDNTLNEDSLFSEIHRASTPYKSDLEEEDDEAYGTMSKSRKAEVQKQIQILEDTNKRLGSSNDELRVALKMMARSGSFRKPKKTSSGNSRRTQSSHSDYGSLSSNRSSRSFSPKHKSLSNGDIGEQTDESTTYDVEEENVGTTGTIAEESVKDLLKENKETELTDNHSIDDYIIENTTDVQNNYPDEDTTETQEKPELVSKNLKLGNVSVDRTDYDHACFYPKKFTRHQSLEFLNEKPSSEKCFRTRSKSLELFYIENLAKLNSGETNGLGKSVKDEFCDTGTFEKSENGDVTRSSEMEENNNDKGLWEITKKLNAYERIRSSLEELSCIEEEGSVEGGSSEQAESEEEGLVEGEDDERVNFMDEEQNKEKLKKGRHEDRDEKERLKMNGVMKKVSENNSLKEFELLEAKVLGEIEFEKKSTYQEEHGARLKEQRRKEETLKAESPGKKKIEQHKLKELAREGFEEKGYEKVGLKQNGLKPNGFQENGEESEEEEESYEEESENESDEEVREESDDEDRENEEMEQRKSQGRNKEKRTVSFNDTREYDEDYDDSYDEESEYSSDEEMSDSSTEQRQDSTATMNSETIADLEAQFQKIKETEEYDDEEEKRKSNGDVEDENVEDEDDDDLMNSAELAELVAMASDLTDVSDSESETGKSMASNRAEEIATMTTNSFSASYSTPERMYKLVLAGDAAVGKSSFILRLCKNKFHSSLNATLGVDFQVKNIKVDAKTVALQLWDTAGQERFRSIAKSYFRKVDGVLLLYDVTCEASFVNIRDWMSTIEESSQKKVPIMLCGNKCDLRDEYISEGRKVVSTESGQRLARHYDALFIETSAKDGKHIEQACKELARILTSLENEEIEQSGLKLEKKDREKRKRPCCPS